MGKMKLEDSEPSLVLLLAVRRLKASLITMVEMMDKMKAMK